MLFKFVHYFPQCERFPMSTQPIFHKKVYPLPYLGKNFSWNSVHWPKLNIPCVDDSLHSSFKYSAPSDGSDPVPSDLHLSVLGSSVPKNIDRCHLCTEESRSALAPCGSDLTSQVDDPGTCVEGYLSGVINGSVPVSADSPSPSLVSVFREGSDRCHPCADEGRASRAPPLRFWVGFSGEQSRCLRWGLSMWGFCVLSSGRQPSRMLCCSWP